MSLAPFDLLHLTYLSLRGNLLRSTLTCLGVFMGVTAVSATLQVRSISRAVIAKQLAEREAPQIILYPRWQRGVPRYRFRLEDMQFLRQRLVGWQAISSSSWAGSPEAIFLDRKANPYMRAVSEDFLATSGQSLLAGRFFSTTDFENYRPAAVIDSVLGEQLFQKQDPIGQRIYADRRPYFVVGVIESKLDFRGSEPQGEILVPLSVHRARTGSRSIGSILVRPRELDEIEKMEKRVQKLLEQRLPGRKFWAWSNVSDIIEQQQTLTMVSRALLAVGGIALLVGGVGIANITIASVMERTPEIGLRRALGATQRDIMFQFILEAALLSILGGSAAIGTVHGITIVVADTFELPYQFDSEAASLALGSALLVGIGAGFFPALQASKLDPVKALRSS